MITRALLAAGLTGVMALCVSPPQAGAVVPVAKPIGGCALLGSANAARILGGPVAIVTEENQKTPMGLVRSCTYSGAGIEIPYTVTTYPSAVVAKQILSTISEKMREPRDGYVLMSHGNPKIKGYPSVVDYLQLIPLPGEPPPQSDFLSQVVVRKGPMLFVTETATDAGFDATLMLRKVANIVVPRM